MKRAFLFPGQGSQSVGMGKALAEAFPAARDVFAELDEALSQKLSTIIFEGPEADLKMTENTQPALMAVSMAVMRVLEKEGGKKLTDMADVVAGHSLGEYTALCAAGAFSISDAARLLRTRGAAMQAAVPAGMGAMAALLGVDMEQAGAIAKDAEKNPAGQDQVCTAANDNAPGQVVISGHKEAVERAVVIAAERGFKRSVILPVSAPFHCALMQPAADVMQDALAKVAMKTPVLPLMANVTANLQTSTDEIKKLLVQQVTGAVRWRESMLALKEKGMEKGFEVGAGTVLAGLMKRIDKEVTMASIGTPADIEAFLKTV